MAEKTLNTRIISKHGDLSSWNSSSLALKTGEIALARVETTKPDGHGGFYKVPTYLMKVGDNNKTFSQLEWLAAPASDVYEWAKKSSLAAVDMPVLSETDAARIVPTVTSAIASLEEAVGSGGTVAEMITAAIEALDVTDTAVDHQVVTAVSQEDGKVVISRKQLAVADIDGLQAALDAKLDVATYNADKAVSDKAISDNASAISGNTAAITAETEARELADQGLQANIDKKADITTVNGIDERLTTAEGDVDAAQADATKALNTIGGTYSETSTVAADITSVKNSVTAEAEARELADQGLQGQIDAVKATADAAAVETSVASRFTETNNAVAAAQADATNALNTIGGDYTKDNTVAADITAVKNSVTAEAEARADADEAQVERIAALEDKIVDLTGAMHFKGVLSEVPSDLSSYVEGDVIIVGNKEYVLEVNDETSAKRFVEFGDVTDEAARIGELETAVEGLTNNKADKTYVDSQDQALQANIDKKADSSTVSELDTKVTGIDTRLGTAEGTITDHGTRLGTAEGKISANEGAIADLQSNSATKTELSNAQTALQEAIDLKASQADHEALAGRVTTAEGTITDHGTRLDEVEAAIGENGIAKEIDELQAAVANVYTKTEVDEKVTAINEAIEGEATARDTADKKHTEDIAALAGRMDTAEGNITTNANGIAANLASIGTINTTLETKADKSALEAVDARVAAIEADYLTAADTYIFDCGGVE